MRFAAIGFYGSLGLFALGCGSGSSGSTGAQCMQVNAAVCMKVFTCTEAASFRDTYGASQSDCMTMMNLECRSSASCPDGQTYHADKAAACVTASQNVTCSDIGTNGEGALFPTVCTQVCTGP